MFLYSLPIAKAEQLHHQDILDVSMVAVFIGVGSEQGVVCVGAGGGVDDLDCTMPVFFVFWYFVELVSVLALIFGCACWSCGITAYLERIVVTLLVET